MQKRERRPGQGDVRGPTRGDFTDWDNPEDAQTGGRPAEVEDAPEGYYDGQPDEEYELGPDDPDYDLSEGVDYSGWEDRGRSLVPMWVIVAISLLLIFAMLLPALLRLS